jgi:hypothetical protein
MQVHWQFGRDNSSFGTTSLSDYKESSLMGCVEVWDETLFQLERWPWLGCASLALIKVNDHSNFCKNFPCGQDILSIMFSTLICFWKNQTCGINATEKSN